MTAQIQILQKVRPKLRWIPRVGEHTTEFIRRKKKEFGGGDEGATDRVLLEAQTILGRCVPPTNKSGTDTGLVVGYVQSGKTLSFTTIMALARDNGYQLVILIAGIATNLKRQSEGRLAKDLGLDEVDRSWVHFENPSPDSDDVRDVQNALGMLNNPRIPGHKRRAVVVTVLKNHIRLGNLVAVVAKLKLDGVPALVIDDEADQASLNTKTRQNKLTGEDERSSNYDWISQLKSALPHHTFLQYTATPQANLLISLADVLSPSFAETLTPGKGYVGGKQFFGSTPPLVNVIPASDIPSDENELDTTPGSLRQALRFFLLGAAAHTVTHQRGNRSMMIHPSQQTAPHADYKSWVREAIDEWTRFFLLKPSDPAFRACAKLFEPEYKSLAATQAGMPSLSKLLEVLPAVLFDTRVVQVNSTKQGERDVRWHKSDYWVLIGGQKLDRGFTVEGLTVTYMPRPIGTGSADTLQQRARFFGYKAEYRGLCRVFLVQDVKDAFQNYIEHESFIRDALEQFRGRPLLEWKRSFLLDRRLSPTRANVIGIEIRRIALDEGWVAPGGLYKDAKAVAENRELFDELIRDWRKRFKDIDAGSVRAFKDKRADSPRNRLISGISTSEILEKFLLRVRLPDADDSENHTGIVLAVQSYLREHPKGQTDVLLIGGCAPQVRSLVGARINQVFQGKAPNTNEFDKLIYVGDRALFSPGRLTLHLRRFNLKGVPARLGENTDVPWFSLHLSQAQVRDAVVQAEGARRARR